MSYPTTYDLDFQKDFIVIQDDTNGALMKVDLCTLYKALIKRVNPTFLKMKCILTDKDITWTTERSFDDCLTDDILWDYPVNGDNYITIDRTYSQWVIKLNDEINCTFDNVSYKCNDSCNSATLIRSNTMAIFTPSENVEQIEFVVCCREVNCGEG